MHEATTLILIATGAFVLPLVAGRLRVPAVVLEIFFGIAIGPAGAGLVTESELLGFLAEFGLLLLMFLSGFEIDFGRLQRQGPGRVLVGTAMFGLTFLMAALSARALGFGFFFTFLLVTTSMGLVVTTLRTTRRMRTPLGQLVLIVAILADFLSMIAVTIYASIHERGIGTGLLRIPALFALIALALWLLRQAAWWWPEKFERLFSPQDPEEMGIRASLALLFVFVGLSIALDIEPILGAFLAGTVFALVFRHRGSLEPELRGFSFGFLIPIFFINTGIRFDLDALLQPGQLRVAGLIVVIAIAVKMIPSMLLLVLRISFREAIAAGVLLSARLSLVVAIAAVGVRLGIIDRGIQSAVILLVAVTATIGPILFRILAPAVEASAGDGRDAEVWPSGSRSSVMVEDEHFPRCREGVGASPREQAWSRLRRGGGREPDSRLESVTSPRATRPAAALPFLPPDPLPAARPPSPPPQHPSPP